MSRNVLRVLISVITVFSFIISSSIGVYAQERYDNDFLVRVGLYYSSGAKTHYNVSGEELYVSDGTLSVLESRSDSVSIKMIDTFYVSQQSYSNYLEAKSMNTSKNGFVFYSGGSYYLAEYDSSQICNDRRSNKVLFEFSDGAKLATEGTENIYLKSSDEVTKLENKSYRGKFNFYIKGSKIHAINELGMQDYLYGVVPKEMVSSWELEALKAQAVVAKNYTITNYNKHRSDGFNVCSTTHCQVYGGYSAEQEKTNRAVDQTEGIFMSYDSKPAEGYFHASSGGRTESIGNMWNYSLDYMVGVDDPYSLGSPYDNWQVSFTASEIKTALLNKSVDIGNIVGLKVIKTSENGRVMELGILGTKGMHVLKKDNIRSTLGSSKLKNTYFSLNNSASFQKTYSSSANSTDIQSRNLKYKFEDLDDFMNNKFSREDKDFIASDIYMFYGKGNGHGIGLSQYGANGMAKKGFDFEEILKYYFKGISI